MNPTILDIDGPLLWDATVGRGFRLHDPSPDPRGLRLRVDRWATTVLDGVWCWHRASLRVPGGVFAPDQTQVGPSGPAYRHLPLSEQEQRVVDLVNDARTGRDLMQRAEVDPSCLTTLRDRLCAHDVAAVQLRNHPPRPNDPSLSALPTLRVPNARTEDQHDHVGRTSLQSYHQDAITDGSTHFDDRETTIAHAFGVPHPGLDGQRYGDRLRHRLRLRAWPVDGPVVEVGCGTGELALGWGRPHHGRYRRIDLSPELLRTQDACVPWSEGTRGDLLDLPLPDESVPLLLCNEVLADLPAVPGSAVDSDTAEQVDRFGLPPTTGFYNPGTFRALEETWRVLQPGGFALFTEFGVVDGEAVEADQLDHPEVAIHFGHARHVAQCLGFDVELMRLDDLMGARLHEMQLSRVSFRALRAWTSREGLRIPSRAWTPASLAPLLPSGVQRLHWVPLTREGTGPLFTRFWALLLHKPDQRVGERMDRTPPC